MRRRLARKIYFPKDVVPAYRSTTIDRAFHRLRLGNPAKWRRLSGVLLARQHQWLNPPPT